MKIPLDVVNAQTGEIIIPGQPQDHQDPARKLASVHVT
jgi:hypothetical protein